MLNIFTIIYKRIKELTILREQVITCKTSNTLHVLTNKRACKNKMLHIRSTGIFSYQSHNKKEILPAAAEAAAVPAESRRVSVFCWRPHSRCSRCRSIYTCCKAPGAASTWPLAAHSCTWPVDWCSYEDRLSQRSTCSSSLGNSWIGPRLSPICRHQDPVPVQGVVRRTVGLCKTIIN